MGESQARFLYPFDEKPQSELAVEEERQACVIAILNAVPLELALSLFEKAINDGPLAEASENVAENLLFILYYTPYISIKNEALKRLEAISFPRQTEACLLYFQIIDGSAEESESLSYLQAGLEEGPLSKPSKVVLETLLAIVKGSNYTSVRVLAIQALVETLKSLALPEEVVDRYRDTILRILGQNEEEEAIDGLANEVIYELDVTAALEKCVELMRNFAGANPERLRDGLLLIMEKSLHLSIKRCAAQQLAELEMQIYKPLTSQIEDGVGTPLGWRPIIDLKVQ